MIKRRRAGQIGVELMMIVLAAIFFIPVFYLFVTTFKTPDEATLHPMSLPENWSFANYKVAWDVMQFPHVLLNTLIVTVTSVGCIIIFSSMAAYGLARRNHGFHRVLFYLFLAGMMVPFQMGLVSLYKLIMGLGIMDSLWSVIVVNIGSGCVIAIFLFHSFIHSAVPLELEEAAFIDGCSVWGTFWKIAFPLLTPVIATVAIVTTLNVWNDFMNPLLFLQSREHNVILLEVFRNIGQFSVDWTNLFPMLLLGVSPLLIFYLFMQKYMIKGVAAGALKG
ncbi:raffinose/stachyose/melibiose transport system permease protein [Paenibacillus shirakamiensis]|uniref:Raffinose/stachyose/melibiose transport system permease protein n=1 Tax=Paenibacillus shirakamiensis TaxID=1265935 RepID=A0ABS4JER3_9BACL|nr:carbohydrate ABC transporter permease [Paenibacillus shirakamiensis]MBP2000202.1 raffinose/stachyose/melibiose transport system permease protein [Paenibacillus shirakamiensis]